MITAAKDDKYIQSEEDRFQQGILDSNSIDFIRKKKLNITDIAGYTNGYYEVFADIDIFKAYEKDDVKENALPILRNALTCQLHTIDEFANLFHFPGNLPKFVNEFDIEVEYEKLYDSFMKFLEISLLNITNLKLLQH